MAEKKKMMKKVRVAKGVMVKRGLEDKMRSKKGSSNSGKYKNVEPSEFAGKSGGASKYSFPINTKGRARNALARAHYAPNQEGIKAKVYREYPELKKHHEKQEEEKSHKRPMKEKKKDPKPKRMPKTKETKKVTKVMREWKSGTLHSGSKKGPKVTNRKQAVAIALSEARRVKSKKRR